MIAVAGPSFFIYLPHFLLPPTLLERFPTGVVVAICLAVGILVAAASRWLSSEISFALKRRVTAELRRQPSRLLRHPRRSSQPWSRQEAILRPLHEPRPGSR